MSAIQLLSPLSPDECVARLREAVDPGGLFFGFGSKPVIGRVSRRSVSLRKRIGYSNSFQTFVIGTFEPHGEGAAFRGTAGTHPLVIAFAAVWVVGLLFGFGMMVVAETQGRAVGDLPLGLAGLALMLALGALGVRLARYLARREEAFLVTFVAVAVNASGGGSAESSAAANRPHESVITKRKG
jgi:hypothetical protein